jgi:hypothetical protein
MLKKAESWQTEHGVSDEVICGARLALDQFPLSKQVQIMTDYAKKAGAIIAGVENPVFVDGEQTLAELGDRLEKTKVFLQSLKTDTPADSFATTMIPMMWMKGKGITAKHYVETYGLSQFYFHYVTAYSILRHYGLAIGKGDYIGTTIELHNLA